MEYVPNPDLDARVSLRDIATTSVNGFGTITGTNYTAFNKFIDTYDVDDDGIQNEVLNNNWARTGVLEMDCLLCHLEGYDYDARTAMLRDAKFDASRSVGAGIAAPNTVPFETDGYGTDVLYNDMVDDNGSGVLELTDTVLLNIKGAPPSKNCAFCHANFPGVDWKKRGDSWRNERTDAHYVLQCMGCHEAKVGSVIGTSGDASSPDLGQCDPAKGVARYSGLQNAKDASIKTCEDCHLRAGYDSTLQEYSPDYGAPDPTGTHEYYGLTAKLCQSDANSTGPSGADSSHLDIVGCEACHISKLPNEPWNTGGAVVDASGRDHAGRMADHENQYVQRSIANNLVHQWQYGKVIPTSVLTTLYWRDKSPTFDANSDGYIGGAVQDPPLTTHILAINNLHGWTTMTHDNMGIIDGTVLGERISALNTELKNYTSNSTGTGNVKLCSLAVPFIVTHNVSPASYALGHACSDCHSASSDGLWNGNYQLMGDQMSLNATAGQLTLFTKRNPENQITDFHYNLRNKSDSRVICIQAISDNDNATTVTRDQTLYEDNLTYGGNYTGADGSGPYTSGTAWVAYLNSINVSACSCYPDANASATANATDIGLRGYGIGCNTGYGTVNATHCVMTPWDLYEVDACKTIGFHAEDVCGGEYYWNFNDASGFEEGTQFSVTGQNVTHEFRDLGIFKIVLTVKNLYGNVDSHMIMVNVVKP
jgi:hypothetical protein